MIQYMRYTWGVNLKNTTPKQEVIDKFLDYVNEDNVIDVISFFTQHGLNYTAYQTQLVLGISKYRLEKLIKEGELKIISTYKNQYYSKLSCRLFDIIQVHNLARKLQNNKISA